MSVSELGIFIADGRTSFQPGEKLDVSALWALAEAPESLEVRVFWYTQGKGGRDVGIVATERVAQPAAAGERSFHFKLPQEPWSFSGKLISLIWAVELIAEPGERSERAEFTLAPNGAEILLHAGKGDAEGAAGQRGG